MDDLAQPLAVSSFMRYNNGVGERPVTLSINAQILGVDGKPYFMYNKYMKQCNELSSYMSHPCRLTETRQVYQSVSHTFTGGW